MLQGSRTCYDDATRRLLPWNLVYTKQQSQGSDVLRLGR